MASKTLSRRALFTNPSLFFAPTPTAIPYTPLQSFYREPRSTIPRISRDHWHLGIWKHNTLTASFTFDELTAFPTHTLDATLCNMAVHTASSGMISHARWQGISIRELLADNAADHDYARVMGIDGRSAMLLPEQLGRAFLAFMINGETLTAEHGFPARLIVPGLYDYKMPRWMTRIELSHEPQLGYWEHKGFINGEVRTFSTFSQPQNGQRLRGKVHIHGIAYAGLRRIISVEINIDGAGWMPVTFAQGEPGCWSTWSTDWQAPMAGSYTMKVRASDDEGYIQHDHQPSLLNWNCAPQHITVHVS